MQTEEITDSRTARGTFIQFGSVKWREDSMQSGAATDVTVFYLDGADVTIDHCLLD